MLVQNRMDHSKFEDLVKGLAGKIIYAPDYNDPETDAGLLVVLVLLVLRIILVLVGLFPVAPPGVPDQ